MRELEIITAAVAADGKRGPRRAKPGDGPKHAEVHTECLNCGAELHGRYCHACGQGADDHHRSILHLIWEVVEDITHLDGRLMRTLPPLFLRPGQLARDHFEGRRQRHVPPLRLFLITLLIFMFSLEVRTHHKAGEAASIPGLKITTSTTTTTTPDKPGAAPGAAMAVAASSAKPGAPTPADRPVEVARSPTGTTVKVAGGALTVGSAKTEHAATVAEAEQGFSEMQNSKFGRTPFGRWVAQHGRAALANKATSRRPCLSGGTASPSCSCRSSPACWPWSISTSGSSTSTTT